MGDFLGVLKMIRKLVLVVAIHVFSFGFFPVYAQDTKASNDTTGVLYDKIADYILAGNEVYEKRFCVLATGIRTSINKEGPYKDAPLEFGITRIHASEPNRKLRLEASTLTEDPFGRKSESWCQRLKTAEKTYVRRGVAGTMEGKFTEFSNDKLQEEKGKIRIQQVNPFADAVLMAHGIELDEGRIVPEIVEKILLLEYCELEDAKYTKEGDIQAKWKTTPKTQASYHLEILFSKSMGYMPTLVRYYAIRGPKPGLLFSSSNTVWERQGGRWIPINRKATWTTNNDNETHYEIKYQWLFEDQLKEGVIDVSLFDWREPFRVLFDEDWQRPGRGVAWFPEQRGQ